MKIKLKESYVIIVNGIDKKKTFKRVHADLKNVPKARWITRYKNRLAKNLGLEVRDDTSKRDS